MLNREMTDYSDVQLFKIPKPEWEDVAQAPLIEVHLLKGVWILRLKAQNIIYWSYYQI